MTNKRQGTMKIVSAKDIKGIDARTVEEEGITSFDLMKRTAGAITKEILKYDTGGCFHVFAGPGNNGGDAILTALDLHNTGRKVCLFLFNTTGKLSEDCEKAKAEADATEGFDFVEVTKTFDVPKINADDMIIDGLFGTGLSKPLSGGFANMVAFINSCTAQTFSIDIPSGLMCEDNSFNNLQCVVKADRTFTVQMPKLALLFQEFGCYTGEVQTVDIGLSTEAIDACDTQFQTLEREEVACLLKKRKRHTHKGDYGRALLIAGSYGMSGAAALAAKGCLRSGVGLLKLHVPNACVGILQTVVPEAMACADYHEHIFTSPACAVQDFDTIGIGPGLGQDELTAEGIRQVLTSATQPMVIDADALNAIAQDKQLLKRIPADSILTPHIKEFDRIAGKSKDPYERMMKAIALAEGLNLYIVLKSSFTSVVTPQGQVYINTIGNPGMATGGSGDVLTGVLTALLAQHYTPRDAALLGTYAHSLAGDIAAASKGEIGMTALDMADCLPEAWKSLEQ